MNFYELSAKDAQGNLISMSDYRGKVLLIVNTATKCGLTPQYTALEELYNTYRNQGFEILDFPCNQFLQQAPGSDEEIESFCTLNYGTTFKRFAKIDVNGANTNPVFVFLKAQAAKESEDHESKNLMEKLTQMGQKFIGSEIKWNFTKFLIDKNGKVAGRFAPTKKPEAIAKEIEKLLSE